MYCLYDDRGVMILLAYFYLLIQSRLATLELPVQTAGTGLCSVAEPGGPWCLTFPLGQLENVRFFIQIACWAP